MSLADNPLLKPCIGKPAILDANILLLHWCASFDPELIRTFKRLNSFEAKDIEILTEFLKVFSNLRTTPHVLTEVSNLANSLPQWRKGNWSEHFSKQIQLISEDWTPAGTIAAGNFMRLGLTDAALARLASTHVVLTLDFPLSNALESQGLNVVNFTHLRSPWLE